MIQNLGHKSRSIHSNTFFYSSICFRTSEHQHEDFDKYYLTSISPIHSHSTTQIQQQKWYCQQVNMSTAANVSEEHKNDGNESQQLSEQQEDQPEAHDPPELVVERLLKTKAEIAEVAKSLGVKEVSLVVLNIVVVVVGVE